MMPLKVVEASFLPVSKSREDGRDTLPLPASEPAGHRHEHPERVFEEGQDEQNDPRPSRENLSGTPLGSDPRE